IPLALVETFNPDSNAPGTVFDKGAAIGIRVTIQDGAGHTVDSFSGEFAIPVMRYDAAFRQFTGTVKRLKLTFKGGIAERIFDGFTDSGDFGVDSRVSDLARIPEPYIITGVE